MDKFISLALLAVIFPFTSSTTVTDIQGPAFRSPLVGQTVHNVTGLVTAKASTGFYITGEPVDDIRVSNGLSVFSESATVLAKVSVGDMISLSGIVAEFRSASSPNDLSVTELDSPTDIVVISSNNTVTPVILGKHRSPPTQQLSALDKGPDGFLSVPNNSSRVDTVNATLHPNKYGMDFWESLEGQLVTVPSPIALDFENEFGEIWVHGKWPVTGKNSRGGLTITFGPDGVPDANPEVVFIAQPLDNTKNPTVAIGVGLSDITGVVAFQFGFFYILPLTAPTVISTPSPVVPPTKLSSKLDNGCALTLGDYNVDNLAPTSPTLPAIANHIATFLGTPDLVFLQEIQDNSGPTDDGTVSGNVTLSTLVAAIANASNGVTYDFIEIVPVDDQDGGEPGGNIRQAYLYRPEKLSLVPGALAGGSLDATAVKAGPFGKPTLSFNPGRIDPINGAWNASRKPLVAEWETRSGATLFTVNLHLTAKSGGSSTEGDARPPVNLGVDQRTSQINEVTTFVKSILALDRQANVIVGGDCNEFLQARSVFSSLTKILTDIDEVAGIDPVERYTYVFDQCTEQLDHIFLSDAIKNRGAKVDHVHVNNWASNFDARASDHDPSVAKIHVC